MPKPKAPGRRKPISALVVSKRGVGEHSVPCATLSAVAATVFGELHYGVEPGDTIEIRLCGRVFRML